LARNILLFRDELGHQRREPTIRAKISDFGKLPCYGTFLWLSQ
jgi:hypothetical protein